MAAEHPSVAQSGPIALAGPVIPAIHKLSTPPSRRTARQLSEEALAKKRANDREAQRNIREKTRQKIEGLERRVKELESGEAFQQLQAVVRDRERLRAENDELKGRLVKILDLVTPALPPQVRHSSHTASPPLQPSLQPSPQATAHAPLAPGPASLPPHHHSTAISHSNYHSPSQDAGPKGPSHPQTNAFAMTGGPPGVWAAHNQLDGPTPPVPQAARELRNASTSPATAVSPWADSRASPNAPSTHPLPSPSNAGPLPGLERHVEKSWTTASRNGASTVSSPRSYAGVSPWQQSSSVPAKRPHSNLSSPSDSNSHVYSSISSHQPIFSRRPNNDVPQAAFTFWCRNISPIMQEKMRLLEAGHAETDVVGPPDPDFTDIEWVYGQPIDPDHPDDNLSHFVMQLIKAFSGINEAPKRISAISTTYYFLRWYISPTRENYETMPDFMRPIQEQLDVPHPVWVDYIQWPSIRAKMVYLWRDITLDTFFQPYSGTLEVNWPYGSHLDDVLCRVSSDGFKGEGVDTPREHDAASALHPRPITRQRRMVRPAFAAHIRRLENWSLGPWFSQWFPTLAGTHRVTQERRKELFS